MKTVNYKYEDIDVMVEFEGNFLYLELGINPDLNTSQREFLENVKEQTEKMDNPFDEDDGQIEIQVSTEITYYADNRSMGDTSDSDCDKFREWAEQELKERFPYAETTVSSDMHPRQSFCSSFRDEDEVEEFCSRLWDNCPWDFEETEVFSITSSEYDPDLGGVVTVDLNGEESDFIVQLTGGEHSRQMGCWISHDSQEGDFDFDETPFEDYSGKIIKAGEKSYKTWVKEQMDEEVKEGEVFEFYDLKESRNCSATSSSRVTIEKSNKGRLRSYLEGCGFTQPNDYSNMSDFKGPIYYDDESDYLENNTDDSLIEEN